MNMKMRLIQFVSIVGENDKVCFGKSKSLKSVKFRTGSGLLTFHFRSILQPKRKWWWQGWTETFTVSFLRNISGSSAWSAYRNLTNPSFPFFRSERKNLILSAEFKDPAWHGKGVRSETDDKPDVICFWALINGWTFGGCAPGISNNFSGYPLSIIFHNEIIHLLCKYFPLMRILPKELMRRFHRKTNRSGSDVKERLPCTLQCVRMIPHFGIVQKLRPSIVPQN
jgi:hypothetical protein